MDINDNPQMTHDLPNDRAETSLFSVATAVLRYRRRVVMWIAVGVGIAAVFAAAKPLVYVASASFLAQGSDANRSALAGLAGEFGIQTPAGTQSLSPAFYATIVGSRAVLQRVVRDTVLMRERGGRRVAVVDLLGIPPGPAPQREEQAVGELSEMVSADVSRSTGAVTVSVASPTPDVSVGLTTALVEAVNEFAQQSRQAQASEERRFVEGRLTAARSNLRTAEDRLQQFLNVNRQFGNSPERVFQHDRLQRDVTLQQQVYTSLVLAYEDVRIREVRDTPIITVIEPPYMPTAPLARGRLRLLALGLMGGAFIGVLVAILSDVLSVRGGRKNRDAEEFVRTIEEVKAGVRGVFRPAGRAGS